MNRLRDGTTKKINPSTKKAFSERFQFMWMCIKTIVNVNMWKNNQLTN